MHAQTLRVPSMIIRIIIGMDRLWRRLVYSNFFFEKRVHLLQYLAAALGLRSKAFSYSRGMSIAVKFERAERGKFRIVNHRKNFDKADPYDWENAFDDR